jgi:hypothetical protein
MSAYRRKTSDYDSDDESRIGNGFFSKDAVINQDEDGKFEDDSDDEKDDSGYGSDDDDYGLTRLFCPKNKKNKNGSCVILGGRKTKRRQKSKSTRRKKRKSKFTRRKKRKSRSYKKKR